MVCLACLLPLFLVPIVNILPLLFDKLMARVYRLLGREYRRPERTPPACPYKPVAKKDGNVKEEAGTGSTEAVPKPVAVDDKLD